MNNHQKITSYLVTYPCRWSLNGNTNNDFAVSSHALHNEVARSIACTSSPGTMCIYYAKSFVGLFANSLHFVVGKSYNEKLSITVKALLLSFKAKGLT